MKQTKSIRFWWRRNGKFMIRLAVFALVVWLLQDRLVRVLLTRNFPAAYQIAMILLQFVFYGSICFSFAITICSLMLFARVKKEISALGLDDFKGHPRLSTRAEHWITDVRAGIPRLIMLAGAAGSGKHYLAECVAGELGVPLLRIDAGEAAILGSWGILKQRYLFFQANKLAAKTGCVVLLRDMTQMTAMGVWPGVRILYPILRRLMRELEMLKEARTMRRRVWNRLLVLLGKEASPARPRVIVFGTTEAPYLLSREEFKQGRFEETAYLGRPSPEGRREIIEYTLAQTPHVKKGPDAVDIDELVSWSGYLTAGELVYMITEDAVRHARAKCRFLSMITQADLKAVYRESVLGGEMSEALRPEETDGAAWHEAGHAVLVHKLLKDFRLAFLSIVAHTGWGRWWPYYGVCAYETDIPEHVPSHGKLIKRIKVAYGGMLAEEIQFGEPTIGIGGDTRAIQWMVDMLYRTQFFSRYVKPLQRLIFGFQSVSYPENIEAKLDESLNQWHDEAKELLQQNWGLVQAVATALLEKRELSKQEIKAIFDAHEEAKG